MWPELGTFLLLYSADIRQSSIDTASVPGRAGFSTLVQSTPEARQQH